MKKYLLVVLSMIFSLSAVAADLNPFAYGLSAEYSGVASTLTVNYTLNAPAVKVRVVIYDEDNPSVAVCSQDFTDAKYLTAGEHEVVVNLVGVGGGEYSWKIEVYGVGQGSTTAYYKRMVLNSPMSIDIDNNTNSPYFGRTLVTQPTKNALRGIYEYWPVYFTQNKAGNRHYCNVNWYDQTSESWYYYAHATPLRVRIAQDGTGRIFTTACDVDKDTYLWYVDPANLDSWTSMLTAKGMKTSLNHPSNPDQYVHNISLDVRVEDDGRLNLLLLSGSIEHGYKDAFITGYIYSGTYLLPADFPNTLTGEYTHIVDPSYDNEGFIDPHEVVKSALLPVAINSSSQFDKYGGAWYCGTTEMSEVDPNGGGMYKDKSALVHITRNPKTIEDDYLKDDSKLKRYFTNSGGFRYNRDFSQVLVAYGERDDLNGSYKTARLYNVTQNSASEHPVLAFVTDLGVINSAYESNHIVDFAWDHANNIYVVLRNGSTSVCGIYTFATKYDKDVPFVTPAPDKQKFKVVCDDNVSYTLTTGVDDPNRGSVSAGGSYKSCTNATISATAKAGFRFDYWTVNGNKVDNTANPLTITMTDDMKVIAHFAPLVYDGITWWNLFKNGQDIGKESTAYPHTNERLWRLYQVEFAAYLTSTTDASQNNQSDNKVNNRKHFNVGGFLSNRAGHNLNFLKDPNRPFYWLYMYITHVYGTPIVEKISEIPLRSRWQYLPYCFINRADTAWDAGANNNCNPYCNGVDFFKKEWWKHENGKYDKSKAFRDYGKSEYWRPWWTKYVCGLDSTMDYDDYMPVKWNTSYICASGTVPGMTSTMETEPSKWYQWNTAPSKDHLLVWRLGGTEGRIIHSVMDLTGVEKAKRKLYATYVAKIIDETKDNTDVVKLLRNPNHKDFEPTHKVTVKRSFLPDKTRYNTICLPFKLTTLAGTPYAGAKMLKFTGTTFDNINGEDMLILNFQEMNVSENDPIMPGVPYLIQPNSDISSSVVFDVPYNECSEEVHSVLDPNNLVTFHAVLNNGTMKVDENATTMILVDQNRLALVTSDGTMKGLRGYFTLSPAVASLAAEGKVYMSMSKPVPTAVENVTAPEQPMPEQPKARKIMYNGDIYILHGDNVYTIMGQKVK